MRNFLLTTTLAATLGLSLSVACADDGFSMVSPETAATRATTPSTPMKLFAGVSHSEALPHALEALKPHLEKRNIEKPKSETPVVAIMPPPAKPPDKLEAAQASLASAVAATKPPVLAGQVLAQPYLPAFGVAHETSNRSTAPVLQTQAQVQHYTTQWFMLPSWMAGLWLKTGDMTTQVTDLRTGHTSNVNEWTENRLQVVYGHQRDARGNYWHVNLLPAERDGNSAGKLVRFVIVSQACEQSTPQQLMTRTHYLVSESTPWNHQIVDTYQQESLNHFALLSNGTMNNSSSNRVFTYQGAPVRDGYLESNYAKIAQFSPVVTMNGIDLRASLNDFLRSHGMANLAQ
ncbi:MAG: hypothetical protein IAF58_22745 [Leptolyngbya sp.]|nr:hypothetical protein [Candidatus Melainabacteria bacterium]